MLIFLGKNIVWTEKGQKNFAKCTLHSSSLGQSQSRWKKKLSLLSPEVSSFDQAWGGGKTSWFLSSSPLLL